VTETIITTAKAYRTDKSKVIVIPRKLRKDLGEENTDLFIVKLDRKQRIILEPIIKHQKIVDGDLTNDNTE
jgi:hypothetical protein